MFTHIVKKHYVAIDATRRIVTDPRVLLRQRWLFYALHYGATRNSAFGRTTISRTCERGRIMLQARFPLETYIWLRKDGDCMSCCGRFLNMWAERFPSSRIWRCFFFLFSLPQGGTPPTRGTPLRSPRYVCSRCPWLRSLHGPCSRCRRFSCCSWLRPPFVRSEWSRSISCSGYSFPVLCLICISCCRCCIFRFCLKPERKQVSRFC